MRTRRLALAVVACLLLAAPALAHVPAFPTDNTSPERAVVVPDAAKSWSFYDRLDGGEAAYYRLELDAGQRLTFGTYTPSRDAFTPSLVLMSDAIEGREDVPDAVTVPDGMGTVVFEGERPAHATYEPFAPSANYHTVSVDRTVAADGTYLLAVYEPTDRTGPVGVTVGYEESFTPTEYLRVPVDLVRVHLWEGQSPLVVAGPWLLTLAAGVGLVRSRRRDDWERPLARYALSGAALLVLATAAGTLVQMAVALAETGPATGALVTALFVVVPAASAAWVLRFALGDELALTPRTRVGLLVAGAASLATWAGFLVGPAVLLAVGVAPAALLARPRTDDR